MPIQGTLKEHPLPEVLMSLSMNQQTGTLCFLLEDGSQKKICFYQGAIFILYSHAQRLEKLEKLLVDAKRATQRQIKQVVRAQESHKKFIGDVLIEMKIVDPPSLMGILKNFVESFLFSIYINKHARFEFHPNTLPEDFEMKMSSYMQETNRHIIQCFNQFKSWAQMMQFFPTLHEIFVFSKDPNELPLEKLNPLQKQQLQLIDGKKSVLTIFQTTSLGEIAIAKLISHFIQQGYIRLLTFEEAMQATQNYHQQQRYQECLPFLEYISTLKVKSGEFHYLYADVLEKLNRREESIEHYKTAADLFFEQEHYESVIKTYMKILSSSSSDPEVIEKVLDSYFRCSNKNEAESLGTQLGTILFQQQDYHKASAIYAHLVKLFPRKLEFRKQLALCYREMNEPDLATQQLNIVHRMENEIRRQSSEKKKALLRWAIIFLCIVVVAGGSGVVAMILVRKNKAQTAIATAKKEKEKIKSSLPIQKFRSHKEISDFFQPAIQAYQNALKWEENRKIAKQQLNELEQLKKRELAKLDQYLAQIKKFQQLEKEAEKALKLKNYQTLFQKRLQMIKLQNKLISKGFAPKNILLPAIIRTFPKGAKVEINGSLSSPYPADPSTPVYFYNYDPRSVRITVRKIGYETRHLKWNATAVFLQQTITLQKQYNWEITLDGEGGVFQNPLKIGEKKFFLVARDGYLYSFIASSSKKEVLQNYFKVLLTQDTGVLWGPLSFIGNHVIVGNSRGELYKISYDGKRVQKLQLLPNKGIESFSPLRSQPVVLPPQIGFDKGTFLIGSERGDIHLLHWQNRIEQQKMERFITGGIQTNLYPILTPPQQLDILCASPNTVQRVSLFKIQDDEIQLLNVSQWQYASNSEILSLSPPYQNTTICSTRAGDIIALDCQTGQVLWTYPTSGAVSNFLFLPENQILAFGNEKGEFYVFKWSREQPELLFSLKGKKAFWPIQASPAYDQRRKIFYIPTTLSYREHLISFFQIEEETKKWKKQKKLKTIRARILQSNDKYLLCEWKHPEKGIITQKIPLTSLSEIQPLSYKTRGQLIALDLQTKKIHWEFTISEGGLATTPILTENEVIFATTNGQLFCINK